MRNRMKVPTLWSDHKIKQHNKSRVAAAKPQNPLSVLFVAAEAAPIAKVGGLADVIGALPKALSKSGTKVQIALPYYALLKRNPDVKCGESAYAFDMEFDGRKQQVRVYAAKLPGTKIDLLLYDFAALAETSNYGSADMKNGLYENPRVDLQRFSQFSLAVAQSLPLLRQQPQIVHCHDWHTGLVPFLLRKSRYKTVYTIHNLANQGLIDSLLWRWMGSSIDALPTFENEYNLMATGIEFADQVNTVSARYAQEILTSEYGCGLEALLRRHQGKLSGIVNGIDVDFFNPATDKNIRKRFDAANPAAKAANKADLQLQLGLPVDAKMPLVGLVSRFVEQKGLDLVDEAVVELPGQYVFLGEGQADIERALASLAARFPDKFKVVKGFDLRLAQQIYAAADFFLMPSKFEPCGLGQMIAMRYGALPIVRETGGLADTVDEKVGFLFQNPEPLALEKAIRDALEIYRNEPRKFQSMQTKAMKSDFSWQNSAEKYLKIYRKSLKA